MKKKIISKIQREFEESISDNNNILFDEMLKNKKIKTDRNNNIPLYIAIINNNVYATNIFINELKQDPAFSDNVGIRMAIYFKHKKIIDLLIEHENVISNLIEYFPDSVKELERLHVSFKLEGF
jgi:hypothetical protein